MKDYEKEADELVAKFKRALFKESIMDATRCSILCLEEKIKAVKSIVGVLNSDEFYIEAEIDKYQAQIEYLKSKLNN